MAGGVGGTAVRNPMEYGYGQGRTQGYRGPNDPRGTPGYNGQMQTPWQRSQSYQQWRAQQGQQPGLTGQNQDPYTTNQYSPTGELIGQQQRQPGSQYYNPYYGSIRPDQTQPFYAGNNLVNQYAQPGFGQQQQPMQINLGALMQRMSNPQSKTPQGQGPGGQMNQMRQGRRPLQPSYMPNTWEAPQSGGEA